ncbi:MAG: hypothetical protein QM754_04465 [Tepidisphaeraceae bacterium]
MDTVECRRLEEDAVRAKNWKRWGPYLAERQWATVREDYSVYGDAWGAFPHEHARSRAYRWGEDGLLGICDRECRLCFSVALWNGQDSILKERLFGLTNPQGNHGEDVKELYYYLECSPTHSWMKALYKYPQAKYPYQELIEKNGAAKGKPDEVELQDLGLFKDNKYFDVQAEYAKGGPNDLLIRLTVTNRGPVAAPIHVLPQLWFKNTWSWGKVTEGSDPKPTIRKSGVDTIETVHDTLGTFFWRVEGVGELLFTDNETNFPKVYGMGPMPNHFFKDAFHDYVISGKTAAVNTQNRGTKAAAVYKLDLQPGESKSIRLHLHNADEAPAEPFGQAFDDTMAARQAEYREHLAAVIGEKPAEQFRVAEQAYAGLLWSKQFYNYSVREWLDGDPAQPPPPPEREKNARNREWKWHLYNRDIISMPDKWEYPWYAAWDLAFHMIPMARIDPHFAKDQLLLLLREWYMHPSGQLPAYEFSFSDVNPPVHAWACWRVY